MRLLWTMRRVKAGTMSYGELGQRAQWSRSKSLALSYMTATTPAGRVGGHIRGAQMDTVTPS
jgi:hypothetical protein